MKQVAQEYVIQIVKKLWHALSLTDSNSNQHIHSSIPSNFRLKSSSRTNK